jgi:hypothetical protein
MPVPVRGRTDPLTSGHGADRRLPLAFLSMLSSTTVAGDVPADGEMRVGDLAPDFTLPRVDSGQATLAEFRGHWAVLVFLRYLG